MRILSFSRVAATALLAFTGFAPAAKGAKK